MPRYLFTGPSTTTFPTIRTEAGTLTCEPGDLVDLPEAVDHVHLEPADGVAKSKKVALHDAWHVEDVGIPVVDPPAPAEPALPDLAAGGIVPGAPVEVVVPVGTTVSRGPGRGNKSATVTTPEV